MRCLIRTKGAGLILALALAVAVPGALLGQEEGEETPSLTLNEFRQRLKENKKYLEEAKKRGNAGDAAGMETALENYERGVEGLDRALSTGRFEGNVYEREKAFYRVQKATQKHGEVLGNLLESGKIPEQARPHVEHAMQVSQKGHETALANLQQARAQRRQHEAARLGRAMHGSGAGLPAARTDVLPGDRCLAPRWGCIGGGRAPDNLILNQSIMRSGSTLPLLVLHGPSMPSLRPPPSKFGSDLEGMAGGFRSIAGSNNSS